MRGIFYFNSRIIIDRWLLYKLIQWRNTCVCCARVIFKFSVESSLMKLMFMIVSISVYILNQIYKKHLCWNLAPCKFFCKDLFMRTYKCLHQLTFYVISEKFKIMRYLITLNFVAFKVQRC